MTMATAEFSLGSIGQIAIRAADLSETASFYRDKLGLRFLFAFPGLCFFDCDGIRLMIEESARPEIASSSVIYFRVTDIRAASETLAGRGVAFEREPHMIAKMPDHELWMAFFRDPHGNLLALMSEVR